MDSYYSETITMNEINEQIIEWYQEVENILDGNQNELDEIAALIKASKYIAAFNYVDRFIDNNKIETTENYKSLTTDLYLTLK